MSKLRMPGLLSPASIVPEWDSFFMPPAVQCTQVTGGAFVRLVGASEFCGSRLVLT